MGHRVRALVPLLIAWTSVVAAQAPSPPERTSTAPADLPARFIRIAVRDVVEREGRIVRTMEGDVHLRDAAGVAQFGQIGAFYPEGFGDVAFDRIVITKPDGRRIEVTDGKVETLNPFGMSAGPVPADTRFRRLTVPGLEPGDRLGYRMAITDKALVPDKPAGEFKFIVGPIASEQTYELDVPANFPLSVRLRPDLGIDWEPVSSAGDRVVRRLTAAKPFPVPDEGKRSEALVEPDVLFSSFRTWDDVGRWWWQAARENFGPDAGVRAEAQRLTAGLSDRREKIEALHAFVSGQVRYLNVGIGTGRYVPRPAGEVLTARYGDCKGKHALFAALAAASGIEVLPVLVHSTRQEPHDEVPALLQFDHLISVVPVGEDTKSWWWIDTTLDLTPTGHLPPNLRGKRALLAGPAPRMVSIPDQTPFKRTSLVESTGSIDATGPIRSRVRWTVRDDGEPVLRAVIRTAPRDKWAEFAKQGLAREWSTGEVSDVKAGDPADLATPFWIEYAVEHKMTPQSLEKDWTFWVPLPEMKLPDVDKDAGPGEPAVELKLPDEMIARARIEMPEGMRATAPLSVTLERPFATFRSTYAVEGRVLNVERALVTKQRKLTQEQASAYEAFRQAIKTDRSQEFPIAAFKSTALPETADGLNAAGNEALDDDDDARRAEELYRKAIEKDAKHVHAWNNLGRALRQQGRTDEALAAFTRQIEIDPYDKYAYGNRGALLAFDLGRVEDGEKDLAKQIEVAPFEPDAYKDLAWVRRTQRRYVEQAELLERAVAAKPTGDNLWLQLAWARARTGKGDAAAAVEKAIALGVNPRTKVILARALAAAGDAAGAGRVAREALPSLAEDLLRSDAASDIDNGGEGPLYLGEAWRLVGADALRSGDLAMAERYLAAAWEIASTGDAAVSLAELREKQGRKTEATALLQQAAFFGPAEDNPARRRLEMAITDPEKLKAAMQDGNHAMARRHIQPLAGSAPESMDVRLLLTVDTKGRVTAVRARDPKDEPKLGPVRARILASSIVAANPENAKFKLVRGGALSCFSSAGCHLGVDLLGDRVRNILER